MKHETRVWTLRYKLGLSETTLGCDRAECAACTALIDERLYVPLLQVRLFIGKRAQGI